MRELPSIALKNKAPEVLTIPGASFLGSGAEPVNDFETLDFSI
jgi:hypothetical protein